MPKITARARALTYDQYNGEMDPVSISSSGDTSVYIYVTCVRGRSDQGVTLDGRRCEAADARISDLRNVFLPTASERANNRPVVLWLIESRHFLIYSALRIIKL